MNEQAIALSPSIIKVIPTIEEFTPASIEHARDDFSRYTALGVITGGAFDDMKWYTTDEYANLSLDFSFRELDYQRWYRPLFSVPYRDFVLYVKVFILQLLGQKVLVSLQGIINDLKRIIRTDPEQIYGLDTKLVVIHANACSDFFSHLPVNQESEEIDRLLGAIDELAFRQQEQGTARSLALFDTYFLFHDILHDFWDSDLDEETRLFYYPLYLWWEITGIIPLRPREFVLTGRNCLEKTDDGYRLTLRRNRLKGRRNEVHYSIDLDYSPETYPIPDSLGECIEKYLKDTDSYAATDLDTLFIADTHYRKWKHKKNKRSRFLTYVNLRTILRYFYQEVITGIYGLKVVYEDTKAHLKKGEIGYIHLGDTRHLALINLMSQGGTPMLAMFLAGHDNEAMSFHYAANISRLIECRTYRQYRLVTGGEVAYRTSVAVSGVLPGTTCVKLSDGRCYSPLFALNRQDDCLAAIGPTGEIGYCPSCRYHRRDGEHYFGNRSRYTRGIEDTCRQLAEAVRLVRLQKGSTESIGEAMLRMKDAACSYATYLEETALMKGGEDGTEKDD